MLSILILSYPFKGTYTAAEACRAIAAVLRPAYPDALLSTVPLGDGGGGTLDALLGHDEARRASTMVTVATGEQRVCEWGRRVDGVAVIESARVVGLATLPAARRNPLMLRTRGIGELVLEAAREERKPIWIGLGDTATHDCGIGMASALGYRFFDRTGAELEPVGASLVRLEAIDGAAVTEPIRRLDVTALCDVLNPLTGEDGAARRFLAQKGGTHDDIERMEEASIAFIEIVRRDLGVSLDDLRGAGAAGGLGAGIGAFLGGRLVGGAEFVLDAIGIKAMIEAADLVITGEGRVDRGTLLGKGSAMVVGRARRSGLPALVIAGSIDGERAEMERKLGAPIVVLSADGSPSTIETIAERLSAEVARLTAR